MLIIFTLDPFYSRYVRFPDGSVPRKIRKNPKWWPFLKDTIGAIDGSHIHITPKAIKRPVYCNCKGFVSQNCLFTCDFKLNFTYVLTGWEGLATDAHVYKDACSYNFHTPAGKYFLANAGYPLCPGLLVPYRSVRYHLAKWGRANIW
jgi:hypothetical protein